MVLFLVSAASSYRLQKQVAKHLVNEGRNVGFLYERGDDAIFQMIQQDAAALGGPALALGTLFDATRESGAVLRRHPTLYHAVVLWIRAQTMKPGRLQSLLRSVLPAGVFQTRVLLDASSELVETLGALRSLLAAQLDAAKRALASLRPSVIVACEDGIGAVLPVHAASRQAGVPVVVLPYGYGVRRDLDIVLDAKAARGEMIMADGPWAGLLRAHAPQWIKLGAHAGALMHPEAYIIAAESLGITLRDAWTVHGGYADRLCVESEQMHRVYLDEGAPEAKLAMTGTPYCDVMVRALERYPAAQAALRQPRRINADTTRILVSWPPSYHSERAAFSEFATYREMTHAILSWLQRLPRCTVTVSLHPATLPDDRAAVIETGLPLAEDYVVELIPQHDVFVTYFSSTIRWAVAAGKPVINFDLYKLGLNVYDAAPGVLTATTFSDFQREATRLVSSDEAYAEVAGQQIAVAPQWGTLDGMNTTRVADAIQRTRG